MRMLLFSGKGGVGKSSLAAATGVKLARMGYRTLVMSVDPAHSLADAFDLDTDLFGNQTADPYSVGDKLWIHEVSIQREIRRHWQEISAYVISVLRTTGISEVEAEELAILPGMEELSAMMYVNQFRREERFDVIILDCAPTALPASTAMHSGSVALSAGRPSRAAVSCDHSSNAGLSTGEVCTNAYTA